MFRIIMIILLAGLAPMPCNAEFRDPTQPAYPLATAVSSAINDNELVLSAILISSQSRRATINGISAKQGQTIVIELAEALNPELANTATDSEKKDEQFNKVLKPAQSLSNVRPAQGKSIDPLLAAASGSNNLAQLQDQRAMNTATGTQQPSSAQHVKTSHIPTRSSTIKIISIRKNSVTIDQNGEIKTLQLVLRPYKTLSKPSTH